MRLPETSRLKIGVTGAGNLGAQHARAARDYGARVVAVHDNRLDAAARLAGEFEGAAAFDDLETFFQTPMDGLVIATPPPIREEPIFAACRLAIPLFVEKPPAYDMATGQRCLKAIEDAGILTSVGFNLRYLPLFERLRELAQGQTVHLTRSVCAIDYYLSFSMSPWFLQKAISRGPISEQAIHLLDCTRWVLGERLPTRALAVGEKNMAIERAEFDAENALQMIYELESDPEGGRESELESRVLGTHLNHCGHERFAFELELFGPHLRLLADVTTNRISGFLHGAKVDEAAPEKNSLDGLDRIAAWLKAIETGDDAWIRAPFRDALHTLALVEAAIEGQKHNGWAQCVKL